MAIGYAHRKVIHPGPESSAVRFLAYMTRRQMVDEVTGQGADFTKTNEGEDLLAHGVELPEGAPDRYRDAARLFNDLQKKELVFDRKAELVRYRSGAQLALTETLAMPRELGLEEWKAMLLDFVRETYTSNNVPVAWAIHDASGDQPHAHLLISTRLLDPKTGEIGKKARDLNPEFAKGRLVKDQPGLRWAAFQERWAASRGIALKVDLVGPVPQTRRGKGRFMGEMSESMQRADEAEDENLKALRDPVQVLATLSAQRSVWTENDLGRLLRPLPLQERDEIKSLVLRQEAVIKLEDDAYSTRSVITQEQRLIATAEKWLASEHHGADNARVDEVLADHAGLSDEQRVAVLGCVGDARLAVVRGAAGTGKSYSMKVVRDCYRRSGHRVVGLAPTNTVAQDMGKEGFGEYGTLHRLLACQEKGSEPAWNRKTVLIVDEAGMVDTEMMERLFRRVEETGAKLVLVGDERQLASVQRGGIYGELRRRFGGPEITAVRRQAENWQRQASVALSEGRMKEAVDAYAANGCVVAGRSAEATQSLLLRDWTTSYNADPTKQRFIFTLSNADATSLNREVQARLEAARHVQDAMSYSTVRGEFRAGIGDRIQFHANNRKAGYFNGHVGTIIRRAKHGELVVKLDDGRQVVFDPAMEQGWGLGYSGTTHRGQGKTLPEAFYLHNPYGDSRVAYVGGTRHREALRIYYSTDRTQGLGMLGKQMARRRDHPLAAAYFDGRGLPETFLATVVPSAENSRSTPGMTGPSL